MHSCGNTAIEGWGWPNFWANLASFSPGPACTAARSSRPSCRSRAGTAASRAAGRRAAPRRKSPRARRLPQRLHEGSSVITPRSFSFIWTTPIGPETAVQNDGRPSSRRAGLVAEGLRDRAVARGPGVIVEVQAAAVRGEERPDLARKVLDSPRRCKLARAFRREAGNAAIKG